jgi:hypothetical protein
MKIFKLVPLFVLISQLQNVICDDKYPGFNEVQVGPMDVYYKNQGEKTEFNLVAPVETSSILSETNSYISLGFNTEKKMVPI